VCVYSRVDRLVEMMDRMGITYDLAMYQDGDWKLSSVVDRHTQHFGMEDIGSLERLMKRYYRELDDEDI
jgi:hypothetical protein